MESVIRRDPRAAAAGAYDLAIVGGGVQGVAVALEAARRGLRPVLLERGDFGAATSFNSLRIVHGGLRYLQTLDLGRFAESVRERRWFLRRFPDLVCPLPCLMPLYGDGLRRPAALRLALAADAALSAGRNHGVRADRTLPRGRVVSVAETVARFPAARRDGLLGSALWHDAHMPDAHRVLIAMLRWAVARGATALNRVAVEGALVENGRLRGVEARDVVTGETFAFRAPVAVLCGGPWNDALATALGARPAGPAPAMLAFNLLIDRDPGFEGAVAVAPPAAGARTYFAYGAEGGLLAGTYHAPWSGGPDAGAPSAALVEACLADLRAAIPGLDAGPGDVVRTYWGLLPARGEDSVELTVRPRIERGRDLGGPEGLYLATAIKFTTARRLAETVLARIHRDLGRALPAADRSTPPAVPPPPTVAGLRDLWTRDAERARALVRRIVADEAVLETDDLVLRRTSWGRDHAEFDALDPRLRAFLADPR